MTAPVKFVGTPDGPKVFVKELGIEVPTFTEPPGGKLPAINYHVPLEYRGQFRPKDLANYEDTVEYRTDLYGFALCTSFTLAGERCPRRAMHRVLACNSHGGRLHPLDKLIKEDANDPASESLSRYQQFLAKQIGVDDLDDEELATGGFRASNGTIYRPKKVPRELLQAFNKAIFERAQQELRSNTVGAAQTVAEIMRNKNIEADIRLKAASILLDRNLGKAPQVVALTGDRAFEEVFSDVFTGTRDESRKRRDIIDVEVDQLSIDSPNPKADNGIGDSVELPAENATGGESVPDVGPNKERDSRLFERNPAIIDPLIETKPFDYDLSDHTQDIKVATKKRYASRALGVDLTSPDYPLVRQELPNGLVRHVDPLGKAGVGPKKTGETKRKAYTLNDFD